MNICVCCGKNFEDDIENLGEAISYCPECWQISEQQTEEAGWYDGWEKEFE